MHSGFKTQAPIVRRKPKLTENNGAGSLATLLELNIRYKVLEMLSILPDSFEDWPRYILGLFGTSHLSDLEGSVSRLLIFCRCISHKRCISRKV